MGNTPCISAVYTTARTAPPSTTVRALKTVRLAGFRRLHPIVPDRTAFGAAIEGETHRDHAENQCQSPEHGRPTPHALIIRPQVRHFQALSEYPFPPNAR